MFQQSSLLPALNCCFAGVSCEQHQLYNGTYRERRQFQSFLWLSPSVLIVFRMDGVTAQSGRSVRIQHRCVPASSRKRCPLWSGYGAASGPEAQSGPGAVIEKPSSSGVWGRLGREFPSSQPSWDNAKDSVGQPRRPAVHCYHGKHPQSQRK